MTAASQSAAGAPLDRPAPVAKPARKGKPAGPVVTPRLPTEADMANTLRDACSWTGWRCAHFRPARTVHGWTTAVQGDGKGFPDWVLANDRGGVLFVELKTARGRLSMAQEAWGEALIRAGAIYRVITGAVELDAFVQELADRAMQPPRTIA